MNWKTTIALILLVGAGAGGWAWLQWRKPTEAAPSPTLTFLNNLSEDKITRVEVRRLHKPMEPTHQAAAAIGLLGSPLGTGPLLTMSMQLPRETHFILEKSGNEWSLPGNWQVRPQETKQWFAALTQMRSRFAPIVLADKDVAHYGFDEEPLIIELSFGKDKHVLRLGQEPEGPSPLTRIAFLRLDGHDEVIQLGPGVFAALDRKTNHFRQRRLLPYENVARDDNVPEKVEQLDAVAVEVESKNEKFTLVKKDKDWIVKEAYKKVDTTAAAAALLGVSFCDGPFLAVATELTKGWRRVSGEDRLDPDQAKALLRGCPDLWADKFVETKSAEECGLKEPEYRVTVTKANGKPIKLFIGKESDPRSRFAKLDDNDQLFEIRTDKLSDIAVDFDKLRDAHVARFKTDTVKRLELTNGDQQIVLVKVKEKDEEKAKEVWRFEKPNKDDADAKTVEEFLGKLAALDVKGNEIHHDIDAKTVGLAKPRGRIKITTEEPDKDAKDKDDKDAKKITKEIVLHLGLKEKDDGKTYVRLEGWPRVNEVGGEIWKLASRNDLAYRQRELWRLERDAITRITIQTNGTPFHLEPTGKGWKFADPINQEVSAKEIDALAGELAQLQVERFEENQPKDLAKYELDKPAIKITVTAKNEKPRTLEIGKRILTDDRGRYARLADGNAVFVISEKLAAQLRVDPLEMLDTTLWSLSPDAIERIRYQGPSKFSLEAKKEAWQVVDSPDPAFPADNQMLANAVRPLLQLRAEKFVEFGSKIDWAKFDLAKPFATVTVVLTAGPKDKAKDHVIELGKESPGGGRYARVDKKDAVVQVDAELVKALTHSHLDFADRNLLKFNADAVMTIERKMKDADFEITRREEGFLIAKPGPREGDILTVTDLLRKASNLQAERVVELAPKKLDAFGLDKPAVVTFHLEAFDGSTKKHVIKVGDPVKKDSDERFALIDDRPAVVVLSAALSRHLAAPVLYYADRNLTDFSNVDRLELTRGERKAVFGRADAGWKMIQPVEGAAEAAVIEDIIGVMRRLRADEIVADKGADLKKYGFDAPLLEWRFKGPSTEVHLIVGKTENDQPGARRYGKLGDKASIFLLNSKVSAKLLSECASRVVWPPFKAESINKLTVTNRDKSFALVRKGSTWELADDAKAKVQSGDIANTLNILESLKAARWAIDAKADLKKYGLADPAWKVEIELGKDKQTLWLGDYEDKSKRLFATVPGPRGAVFVIDEIDAMILARPRSAYVAEEKKVEPKKESPKKQVLLLWHSPDGHPKDTHEYQLGQKILKATLEKHAAVEATLICADDPWKDGPELLAKADGVVLFVSEGAKWLNADKTRLAAFKASAKRGMGLAVLHWGMGTKDAKNIDAFVELFGGCHGGPDRKYKVVDTDAKVANKSHPIVRGLSDFKARDEFYYTLKFAKMRTPLLNVTIDGESHPVAWALDRDGGGRSFGFSGLHFHENWQTPEYRRLVAQGVMWTLDLPIPKDGIVVK